MGNQRYKEEHLVIYKVSLLWANVNVRLSLQLNVFFINPSANASMHSLRSRSRTNPRSPKSACSSSLREDCENESQSSNAPEEPQESAVRSTRISGPSERRCVGNFTSPRRTSCHRDVWKLRQFCNLATSSKRRLTPGGRALRFLHPAKCVKLLHTQQTHSPSTRTGKKSTCLTPASLRP